MKHILLISILFSSSISFADNYTINSFPQSDCKEEISYLEFSQQKSKAQFLSSDLEKINSFSEGFAESCLSSTQMVEILTLLKSDNSKFSLLETLSNKLVDSQNASIVIDVIQDSSLKQKARILFQ